MIKVMLVDDHNLVREGFKMLIEKNNKIKVVCEVGSGEAALNKVIKKDDLDLVIIDISLPGMSGIELAKKLKETHPKINILMLSMHDDEEYVNAALDFGAMGYLTKNAATEELIEAIINISKGVMHYSSSLAGILVNQIVKKNTRENSITSKNITERELEVLQLIINGYSNKEIGKKLFVSKRTIENHRSNLMSKMGAKNTADIVRIACKDHLVEMTGES